MTCTTCRFFPDASCLRRQLGNVRLHVLLGIEVTQLLQSGYVRSGWDSNPRTDYSATPVAGAPFQPLKHHSKVRSARDRYRLIYLNEPSLRVVARSSTTPLCLFTLVTFRDFHRNKWSRHRMLLDLVSFVDTESPGLEPGMLVLETRVLPLKLRP